MEAEQASARVAEVVERLGRVWAQALEQPTRESLERLEHDIRDLAVAGRQAGYRRVAELASILEVMLDPIVAGEEGPTVEFRATVGDYMRALTRLASEPPEISPDDEIFADRRVVFVSDDAATAELLRPQLGHFGYAVDRVPTDVDLFDRLMRRAAAAVLVDLQGGGRTVLKPGLADRLAERIGAVVPLLAICDKGDIHSRLVAARAGVVAYQTKPVDPYLLVDELDQATGRHVGDDGPYRILLVEDSQTQAAHFTAVLRQAGMEVRVAHDPMRVLDELAEHPADLMLMDMYMPGCNGQELARVIRQYCAYESIPIVFLSAETQVDRQLDAMSLGGDDFLTKTMSAAHLIRSVTIRAERARTLRSLMVRDNLTGLLNHTRIKEQLKQEVGRAARREGASVAFAMIDIDHFKSINDNHGHPVGDRVLKTIARMLQQRLRQTDLIGRYGGEEFAVIMPDASAQEARHVLDAVRQSFSRIRHAAEEGSFRVTFSAGVSEYPAVRSAGELATLADRALYRAKEAGRNRIAVIDD